jgi:hypothetical protein
MLRKTVLAIAAAATIGAAALAPTSASAWWVGYHGWRGGYIYRAPVVYGPRYGGCMVRRWMYTPYGVVLRWVNRCY